MAYSVWVCVCESFDIDIRISYATNVLCCNAASTIARSTTILSLLPLLLRSLQLLPLFNVLCIGWMDVCELQSYTQKLNMKSFLWGSADDSFDTVQHCTLHDAMMYTFYVFVFCTLCVFFCVFCILRYVLSCRRDSYMYIPFRIFRFRQLFFSRLLFCCCCCCCCSSCCSLCCPWFLHRVLLNCFRCNKQSVEAQNWLLICIRRLLKVEAFKTQIDF